MTILPDQLQDHVFPESLRRNVYVNDVGGTEILTHLHGGELSPDDIGNVKLALSNSLNNAGLLNGDQATALYQLTTVVTRNKSKGFADTTVTTHMQFILSNAATGSTLLNESFATPATVELSDDVLYKNRLGKAMETSIRGNFRALLGRLAEPRGEQEQAKTVAKPAPYPETSSRQTPP